MMDIQQFIFVIKMKGMSCFQRNQFDLDDKLTVLLNQIY